MESGEDGSEIKRILGEMVEECEKRAKENDKI